MISERASARDVPAATATPRPEPWRGEARLVREAILLVAGNGAPRVMVAGLAFGEQVLDELRRPALAEGVRLLARATRRPDRVDIVVEPIR